jgi:hypothetical protein
VYIRRSYNILNSFRAVCYIEGATAKRQVKCTAVVAMQSLPETPSLTHENKGTHPSHLNCIFPANFAPLPI